MILVALLLPPLAVLLVGKPIQALINVVLCLFLWLPGIIHAVIVVNNHNADKRQRELIAAQQAAMEAQTAALIAAQQAGQPLPTPPTPPLPVPPPPASE
jgi:uncharacterized membrane protein YqaE (UPF0057 family)